MNIEQRKAFVQKILLNSKQKAVKEIDAIRKEAHPDYEFMFEHLRRFILAKYMLDPNVEETNISSLAALSLAKVMNLDKDVIRSLDHATPCDQATSESTKRILLLFAVQKALDLSPDPIVLAKVDTIDALTEYVMNKRNGNQ